MIPLADVLANVERRFHPMGLTCTKFLASRPRSLTYLRKEHTALAPHTPVPPGRRTVDLSTR